MTERLRSELERWRGRSSFDHGDDLVFAHPELGTPLDRTKVTRRFQVACKRAEVPAIRFHDLRHTFATQLAASGVPLRTLQEFLGHADLRTTQIYAHYARSEWELDMVDAAFGSTDRKR
jgi:site-specific recombinase XerD